MAVAYALASGRQGLAHARQVMFKARGPILEKTGEESLGDAYFTQKLLPDYINENPATTKDWDVVYDARGNVIEPHTEHRVPLGTLNVREYLASLRKADDWADPLHGLMYDDDDLLRILYPTVGPANRYGAMLFIEKEGFMPLFEKVKLADRYDVAILSTKGMSVTASRRLVDDLCSSVGVPLLILHDFDKSGFSIAGTLRGDTRRYTFTNRINSVDLGLRMADVVAWKLASEPVHYGKRDPVPNLIKNGATDEEVEFLFRGGSAEAESFHGERVELNAFGSDEMVEWIEKKLEANGVKKVLPDAKTLDAAWRRSVAAKFMRERMEAAAEEARKLAAAAEVPRDLRAQVKRRLAGQAEEPWDKIVDELATRPAAAAAAPRRRSRKAS